MKIMCNVIFMLVRMRMTKIRRVFNQVSNLQLKFLKDEKKVCIQYYYLTCNKCHYII